MEQLIGNLVADFEQGKLSRRDLIRGLSTVAAGAVVTEALVAESEAFRATSINHISYQVGDYKKTRDFYAGLLGMKVSQDNGNQCLLSVGNSLVIARNGKSNTPRVDHVAYTIANWNKGTVEAELKRRGLQPRLDLGGNEESFRVSDPDGFDLQISSGPMNRARL